LTEDDVVNAYASRAAAVASGERDKDKPLGNALFAMILFNLVADARLTTLFTSDDLLDLLLSPSLTPQYGMVIDRYVDVYSQQPAVYSDETSWKKDLTELKDFVKEVAKKNSVKAAEMMVDMLDDSFVVKYTDKHQYLFLIDKMVEGDSNLKQDDDTLDTWFSSALWPFTTLGWPENTQDLADYYPNSVLETGYDIIFFRVIRMMIMGVEVM